MTLDTSFLSFYVHESDVSMADDPDCYVLPCLIGCHRVSTIELARAAVAAVSHLDVFFLDLGQLLGIILVFWRGCGNFGP